MRKEKVKLAMLGRKLLNRAKGNARSGFDWSEDVEYVLKAARACGLVDEEGRALTEARRTRRGRIEEGSG